MSESLGLPHHCDEGEQCGDDVALFHDVINIAKTFGTVENPFSFNKEQIPKEVAFGEGTFFSRFARNRTNLFKSFKSFSYLFDLYRFLFHFLLFNCYVSYDESTLTIALFEIKGIWHGVERFEGEGEVGVE